MTAFDRRPNAARKIIASVLSAVLTVSVFTFFPSYGAAAETGMITGKVIYSENFDSVENGSLPEGWRLNPELEKGGSAAVSDGKLVIDATSVNLGKVLLPDSLSGYGDYTVEADVSFKSSKDASRWMSVVFRQQSTDENYYQMCVRRTTTASNGVEFAVRTPGNWNVAATSPAKKDVGLGKEVRIKLCVAGGLVYEYVGDELVLVTDAIESMTNAFKTGAVGIQANYSVMTVDNVTVSECRYVSDPSKVADDKYISHDFLVTPVISAAATVMKAGSVNEIDAALALSHMPENCILYVGDSGTVVSPDGNTVLGTLGEITEKIFRNMIPVYYVKTKAQAEALIGFLKDEGLQDCMVMSDDPELIMLVRKSRKRVGGVLDFTSVTKAECTREKLDEMIYSTNLAYAKTALIKEEIAAKASVEYMQHRLITVWVEESAGDGEDAMLHDSIQSGANGIVTDTPGKLIDAYAFYKAEPLVLVRNPMVIGHRGLPSSAPENTLESAKEAIAAGVDCIELDVRLSSDGKVYIYHDNDLSSLTDGSGTVGSHTSQELDKIHVLKSGGYGTFSKYKKVRLPSLDDYFNALKDEDVMFFIEIKEEGDLSKKTAELVEKYGLKNRCCMITFISSQVTNFQKDEPGMSTGQLMGTPSDNGYEKKVKSIIGTVAPENATFNASGVSDKKMIRALMYRGITAWPWTYNNSNTKDAYLLGAGGITTDFCSEVSYVPTLIDVGGSSEYTLNPAVEGLNQITFYPTVYCRMGEVDLSGKYGDGSPVNVPEPVIIEGAEHVEVSGNTVKALSDGKVRLMYRLLTTTDTGKKPDEFDAHTFVLYTQVITLTLDSGADVEPDDFPSPTPEKAISVRGSTAEIIAVCSVCAGVIVTGCVLLAVFGKRKNKNSQNG